MLRAFLDSQDFYELMQAYRHAPIMHEREVVDNFEAVKKAIEREVSAQAPSALPCVKDRNAYCVCERKAMMCDGFGPDAQAPSEKAEPERRLTWLTR